MKKRIIDEHTPFATIYPLGCGRYAMNAQNGIACTLTGAHHYAGNITHPRQGFREMGVLEIDEQDDNFVECCAAMSGCTAKCLDDCNHCPHPNSTEQCGKLYYWMRKEGRTPLGTPFPS